MRWSCMVKSASFSTDNSQTSRFSFFYRINFLTIKFSSQNISITLALTDSALTSRTSRRPYWRKKAPVNNFVTTVPVAKKYCCKWWRLGNGVILLLLQLRSATLIMTSRRHWSLDVFSFLLHWKLFFSVFEDYSQLIEKVLLLVWWKVGWIFISTVVTPWPRQHFLNRLCSPLTAYGLYPFSSSSAVLSSKWLHPPCSPGEEWYRYRGWRASSRDLKKKQQ